MGPEPMCWQTASQAVIRSDATYLVKTNGAEWRDADLKLLPGHAVKRLLEPQIVRGVPLYVARVTDPLAEPV